MSALYLETSALLRALLAQKDSAELLAAIRGAKRIVTSRLTKVEVERAVIRLSLENSEIDKRRADLERDLRALWSRVDFVEMDRSVCDLAGRIALRGRIRSLDAIHLATFQVLRSRVAEIEMLSWDDRIRGELA